MTQYLIDFHSPKGAVNDKMRMAPMATRLGELIGKPVATVGDCIGDEVDAAVGKLGSGDVLMLENARFYKEEEKNVPEFAEKMAKNASIYVNDAFGTAHRAHASTEGVSKYVDHKVNALKTRPQNVLTFYVKPSKASDMNSCELNQLINIYIASFRLPAS
jgi:3-phosphoglycerate kinase